MRNYALLIFCSLLFCSFQYHGEIDYWKALKGGKNVKYKTLPPVERLMCNFPYESTSISIERKIRTECQFPKSAQRLDLKKVQITGWVNCSLAIRRSILSRRPFDIKNIKKGSDLDEEIEMNASFYEWRGQKVKVTGTLRLNKEDGTRHCYILEDIEQIELVE